MGRRRHKTEGLIGAEQPIVRSRAGSERPEADTRASSPTPIGPDIREGVAAGVNLADLTLFAQDRNLTYEWIENPPLGYHDVVGHSDSKVLPAEVAAIVSPAKCDVIDSGAPRTIEVQIPVGGEPRWYELRIAPRRNGEGEIDGVICAAIDISDRKQSESHLRVLLLELAHRSKNLLAVIQGIANQTAQSSSTVEEFTRRFSGRLMSLSRAHDILSDQNWRGAGMRELIRTQVLLFAGKAADRISFEGDAVYLRPSAAQHVGLALYELTANALRYGALSNDSGHVVISWSMIHGRDGERFQLRWSEKEGPKVSRPESRHFGRILLEEVVPFSVQGDAALDFTPGGIAYRLSMPASELN